MAVQSAQGLDVSNYQGKFNWSSVSGLSFGVYRLTQGLGHGTNSPDPYASWNNQQIKAHGLARGAYHFLDPRLSGAAQAEYFVSQYSAIGLENTDMLWLDNETSGPSPQKVSAAAVAFMTELRKLRPKNPCGVYTYISFATGGNCAGLSDWPLWLAYPASASPKPPPPWTNWTFWQWGTRKGVDADAFNGTADGLQAWIASYSTPAPQAFSAPARTSIRAVAKQHGRTVPEVIWLTASHRQQCFGKMQSSYIAAGNWDAPMPVGMVVWT